MYESARSIRPGWIGFGWFLAVALASLAIFVLTVLEMIRPDAPTEGLGVTLALMFGFGVAGFIVGVKANAAPLLHGLAMGLLSLVVWFALRYIVGDLLEGASWDDPIQGRLASMLAVQTAAAIVGTRMGVRFARRLSNLS